MISHHNESGSRLEIFLNGRGLRDLDFFSKSDPYVKVFFESKKPSNQLLYFGKTETINNQLNPNWNRTFVLDYIFESVQPIRFQVYDDDGGQDELIGTISTTLGTLAGARCQTSMLNLENGGKNMGKLIVRCEKIQEGNQFVTMKWKAEKLTNTDSYFDWWNKSDPYLKFLKIREDNSYIPAAQTEVIDNSLNPSWRTIEIPLLRLGNDRTSRFKVQCWDHEPEGKKHQFIGQIFFTLQNLYPGKYPLVNTKIKNAGFLILQSINILTKPVFLDYLRSGLELNLIVAIDFTGSNGSPHDPVSLHYKSNKQLNQYQTAIRSISEILLNYDSDKLIPSFGFGAITRYPNMTSNNTSHCFPLSGDFENIDAESIPHLEELYSRAIQSITFSGPTLFSPLLTEAFNLAEICKNEGSQCYQILLILTDGEIHDMEQTISLLYSKVHLPLSIIIVGVGNADFTNMRRLDGDEGLYTKNGQKVPRDIVQFVSYRDTNHNPQRLTAELLAELPNQVVQYMMLVGMKPGEAKNMDINQLISNEFKNTGGGNQNNVTPQNMQQKGFDYPEQSVKR